MTSFDSFAVVDWNAGNDRGAAPKKDAIWVGSVLGGVSQEPVYLRNRAVAFEYLGELIEAELAKGRRLMLGFDFPFAYPTGFAAAIGQSGALDVWDFFAEELKDTPQANNRFELAGALNKQFPGGGPFWFNGLKRDISGLSRKKPTEPIHGQCDRRRVEKLAKGTFTCWQMGGAGAVGGQVMTGMAALAKLRQRFAGNVSVWPFEPLVTPIAFVEIWPSLIDKAVRASGDAIKDRAQVRLLAQAFARLPDEALSRMLDVKPNDEGWILGVGFEEELVSQVMSDVLTPPRLKNDCFALPPGVDWTPVDDALARLRDRLHVVVPSQDLAVSDAAGVILAKDVVAVRANPPAANSAVDGYGFAHVSLSTGDQVLPLIEGRAAAGAPFVGRVPRGSAIRILTGALLPEGVDTVVLEEDTTTDSDQVAFEGGVRKGANARDAGEDVDAGDIVLRAQTRLGPPEVALLAATGVTSVCVYRPLRVGVLSTGDEIVAPGSTDDPARTYDANRPMLLSLIANWRMEPVDLGHVGDDVETLRQRLDEGAEKADVILTSGGASAGDEDHVSRLLGDAGSRSDWRIALKPGRPLALGVWNGAPVFGLPGNPVAALVCTMIFARPAFAVLGGEGWREPQGFLVPAGFEKRKKPGRREYLRARMTASGEVEVFKSEGSGRISGLAWADGLVEIEDGARHIRVGDPVRYIPFSGFR